MKRFLSFVLVLLLIMGTGCAEGKLRDDKTIGSEISLEAITDFYFTYSTSTYPPFYQRYRFYSEGENYFFYHETREGGGWPQTEEDITASGTVELTKEQWEVFCDLLLNGSAKKREESLLDGDAGPWLFIYWTGGEKEGREYAFESWEKASAFEDFCISLAEMKPMQINVSDGTHTIIFQLNDSPSAKSLYKMLPIDTEVRNYGSNEKIFYPDEKIDTAGGIEGSGGAGDLALFSPWGNVVMYYDSFSSYPGLYLLGTAIEGADQIRDLSEMLHIEISN